MIEVTVEMERAMYVALAGAQPGRHHAAVKAGHAGDHVSGMTRWKVYDQPISSTARSLSDGADG